MQSCSKLIPTQRIKLWIGGSVSLIIHSLVLLCLALFVLAGPSESERPNFLTIVSHDANDLLKIAEFEVSPMTVSKVEASEYELKQPSLTTDLTLASAELNFSIEAPVSEVVSPLDDWRLFELEPSIAKRLERQLELKQNARSNTSARNRTSTNGAFGNALGTQGGSGNQASNSDGARYFGSRAYGKKFVFVVDASGSMVNLSSMNGIRWTTATQELLRSLHDLRSDCEFFVICFNVAEHPIFGHYAPNNQYLKGDPKTLQLVEEWITNFHPGGNTYPSRALEMAIEMKPDSIFLLSDGEIRDDSIEMLRRMNREGNYGKPRIPIHTILLMSERGHFTLQTIASENGGKFRNVTYREWLAAQSR